MAEHELNKIVDDAGEVFNLRDSTKQPVADRVTAWGSTPSDTKYPSEKLVKTSLDGKSNTGHTHSNIVTEGDNRNVSTKPNDYSNKFAFRGLKTKSAIDNPSSATYSYLFGLRGYNDETGGKAHELAFNDNGIFTRKGGTTSWEAWEKLATSKDLDADYRTKDQDISKGVNLIVNGSGTMKSNYNFSTCDYIANTDLPAGVAGCFHKAGLTVFTNEIIAVNTSKTYQLESWYRVKTASTSTVRLSLECLDIDGKEIQANTICYGVGTLTKLTQDLKNGDTVVHLEDLSGARWIATEAYQRGFIFWNYKNSLGYQYPPETYSRNCYDTLYENANVNVSAGTITLNSAWNKGTIPAGTYVSRYGSGGMFFYVAYSAASAALTTWTKLSGIAKGFTNPGAADGGAFRPGTAFIKVGWVNAKTSGNEWIEFGGIELREIPDSSEKIRTARKLAVSLSNTSTNTSFDGSADVTNIKTTGTLGVGHGGTGKTSVTSGYYLVGNGTGTLTEKTPTAVGNNVLANLSSGSDDVLGTDYIIGSNHTSGATDTTQFVRRTANKLWNYIKTQISSVLGLTATSYGGNAATATTAAGYTSGGAIDTALQGKADASTAVTDVVWDDRGTKLRKTINGTTSDIVTASSLKSAMSLGNVDNTSDATKKTNFTGSVADGDAGFPTGGAVYDAIVANGKGIVFVDQTATLQDVLDIRDAGKLPIYHDATLGKDLPLVESASSYALFGGNTGDWLHYLQLDSTGWGTLDSTSAENSSNRVSSWSSTVSNSKYPSEKLVKDSLDAKAPKTNGSSPGTSLFYREDGSWAAPVASTVYNVLHYGLYNNTGSGTKYDLNDRLGTAEGRYIAVVYNSASTYSTYHAPESGWAQVDTEYHPGNSYYATQMARYYTGNVWYRAKDNSVWSAWKKLNS